MSFPQVHTFVTHLTAYVAISTSSNGGVRPLLNQTFKNSPPLISTFLLQKMTAEIVAHSATECQTVLLPFFLIGFLFVSFFASVSPRSVSDNPSSPIVFVLLCASRKKETGGVVAPPGKEEEETGGTGSSDLPASVRPTSQPRRQEAPVCTHHRADSQDAGSFVHRQKGGFCSARGSRKRRKRRKRRGPPPGEGGLFCSSFAVGGGRHVRPSPPLPPARVSRPPFLPLKPLLPCHRIRKGKRRFYGRRGRRKKEICPTDKRGNCGRKGERESCQAGFFRHSDAPRNVGRTGQH